MGPNDHDTLPAPPMLEDEPGREGFQIGYPIRWNQQAAALDAGGAHRSMAPPIGEPDFDGFASEALDEE